MSELLATNIMLSSRVLPRVSRINPLSAVLFICDVQTKFQPLIYRAPSVINRCALLNDVAKTLSIPIVITEQYPKAFGTTIPEIILHEDTKVFAKRKFSMMTDEVSTHLHSLTNKSQIILCGVEAHVCVQQTVLDLLSMNIDESSGHGPYEVFLISDAISSQRSHDRSVALERMKNAGAIITTTESMIFELLGDSEHEHFKTISTLNKVCNAKGNEFAGDITI